MPLVMGLVPYSSTASTDRQPRAEAVMESGVGLGGKREGELARRRRRKVGANKATDMRIRAHYGTRLPSEVILML